MPSPRWRPAAPRSLIVAGCRPKSDDRKSARKGRQCDPDRGAAAEHPSLHRGTSASYPHAIDTTGTVDFDNDQATRCWRRSPARCRAAGAPGDEVKKGEPWRRWSRPISPPRSAPIARPWSPPRMSAGWPTSTRICSPIRACPQREDEQAETDAASAEADRDAALQGLLSLNVDPASDQRHAGGQAHARIEGIIRSPIAGTVVEKLITPGRAAAGRHHAVLHRRRSLAGLGDGAYVRFRSRLGRMWATPPR